MGKIYLELSIVKVDPANNWQSKEYAAEHFEKGLFVADDGVMYYLVFHQGDWPSTMLIPKELIEAALVEEARQSGIAEVNGDIANDIDDIKDRVEKIARLVGEIKDELPIQRDAEAHEFTLIMEGMKGLHDAMPKSCGGGVNILDVAKSYAVIQKPELIKELK